MIDMSYYKRIVLAIAVPTLLFAQTATNRYALILEDPPVSERFATRAATESVAATP